MTSFGERSSTPAGEIVLAVCVVAGLLLSVVPEHFLVDDAYISFRYALNLALGEGLVYNHGDRLEGYTNFLWVLALAAAQKAGFDIAATSQRLGVLSALATLVVTFGLGRRLLPSRHPLLQSVPALLLASNHSFWFWGPSGMETSLFAFLLALGVFLWLEPAGRTDIPAAAVLFAATLTRPEGVLVFGLLVIHRLFLPGGLQRRGVLPAAGVFAVLLGGYLLWKFWYFGALLPNTFYAKSVGQTTLLAAGARYVRGFLVDNAVCALALCVAVLFPPHDVSRHRTILFAGITLVYAVYVAGVGGDIYYHYRYLMPLLPLIYCMAAVALCRIADILSPLRGGGGRSAQAAVLLLLVLSQGSSALLTESRYKEMIDIDRQANAERIVVAQWLRSNYPSTTTIATVAAGIIPYVTGFPSIDMAGLTNREIGRIDAGRQALAPLAHQKSSLAYVLDARPEFIEFGGYRGAIPRAVGAKGWPLDFTRFGAPFYLTSPRYPARVELMLSETFHKNYSLMLFPLGKASGFMSFRRLPEGSIPQATALANLGWAQYSLGNRRDSLETLRKAAALAPSDRTVRERLAIVGGGATRDGGDELPF